MASSGEIQELMRAALIGKTGAGTNVFSPRTRPTTAQDMDQPIILVQSPTERKENLAGRNGAPQFNVTTTIQVIGRMTSRATADEAAAMALLGALGDLQTQIEVATINDYALRRAIQQYSSVEVVSKIDKDGQQLFGELVMTFALEFYQGPEDFAPIAADPITVFAVYADLVNVFSVDGEFDETPFPDSDTPFPRTSGPDGRLEGLFIWGAPAALDFSDPDNSQHLTGV